MMLPASSAFPSLLPTVPAPKAGSGEGVLFLVLFLCYCLLPAPVIAQPAHPSFHHYTSDEGLPSSEVYEIIQDRRGYLWFGTDNGVSRFDGYEFRNFGAAEGLKNNVVFALFEDPRGRIWMNTMSRNLFYYDYDLDSILAYEHNSVLRSFPQKPLLLPNFLVDSTGAVLTNIPPEGIVRIRPDGSCERLVGDDVRGQILFKQGDHYLYSRTADWPPTDPDTTAFYIGSERDLRETEIYRTDKYSGRPFFLPLTEEKVFFSFGSWFYLFENGQLNWHYPVPGFIVIAAQKTHAGNILLGGLYQQGVRIYRDESALAANIFSTLLSGQTVSHILQDRDRGLWFSTVENGVFYAPAFDIRVFDHESGLSSQPVTAIAPVGRHQLMIGYKNGEIYLLDEQENRISRWYTAPDTHTRREILDLVYDPQHQTLWAAVTEKGALAFPMTGTENHRTQEIPFKDYITGTSLHLSSANHTLEVATNKSFLVIDPGTRQRQFDSNELSPSLSERITAVFRDSRNRLWIGKLDGLFEFDGHRLLPAAPGIGNLSLRVEAIAELPDGTLVVGTKGAGLILWKDQQIREIGQREGLTSGMVENLHLDAAGTLWVGTLNGLNKITRVGADSFDIERITQADGLPSNEIRDITSIGSEVWIATTRGIVKLPPKKTLQNPPRAPILVDIRSNGQAFTPNGSLTFRHYQSNIQISFLSIDFRQTRNIQYRYRLQPKANWSFSHERSVNYPELPPGNYEFEVQAQNSDGAWSPSSSFSFVILPPLWYKLWFWGIILSLLSLGAYGYYRRRFRELQGKALQASIQANLERELKELEGAALRAQINPHFIANSLNAIQGFIVKGEKLEAMRYLSSFHQLLRKTLDLSRQPLVTLEEDIALLKIYLDLEKLRCDSRFDYSIEVAEDLDLFETSIPPLLVQPYVENAVLHGFPPEVEQPRINISYQSDGDRLVIVITDNGIGISEHRRRQAGKKEAASFRSYGMEVPKKRLALLDKGSGYNKVEVEEYSDGQGNLGGTRIRLVIDNT